MQQKWPVDSTPAHMPTASLVAAHLRHALDGVRSGQRDGAVETVRRSLRMAREYPTSFPHPAVIQGFLHGVAHAAWDESDEDLASRIQQAIEYVDTIVGEELKSTVPPEYVDTLCTEAVGNALSELRELVGLIEGKMQAFAVQLVAKIKQMPPSGGCDMELVAKDMAAALGTELATEAVALLTRRHEVDGDEDCAAH